ncbi:MAG: flagellar basal body-associated FliL family protein [Thermodesulfobacteriota bacterium]|nr:flagellar basal body-associated FliL family protein [Thermodesulfobacteriota bacterium]
MADDQPNEEMEEAPAEAPEEEGEKKKPAKLKWIIIGGLVILLVGGGAGAWWFLSAKNGDVKNGEAANGSVSETASSQAGGKGNPTPFGTAFELDPFVVNLKTPEGESHRRYLKVEIELEFTDEMLKPELDQRLPQIRDTILMHLGTKTADELRDVQDKITLKNELMIKLNRLLIGGKIKNVYFVDFIIQ